MGRSDSVGMRYAMVFGLVAGMGLGTFNLVHLVQGEWEGVWIQLHGHLQLMGWVGLFIIGVGSHAIPRFAGTSAAQPRWLSQAAPIVALGLLLRVLGQLWDRGGPLWVASAVLECVGLGVFAGCMTLTLWRARCRALFVPFVLSSLAWGVGSTVVTLVMTVHAVRDGQHLLNPMEPVVMVQLLGFAGLMILGFLTQALPRFLGLRPAPKRSSWAALVVLNGSLLASSALGWLAGCVWMVYNLGVWQRPERTLDPASRAFRPFLLASLGWLLVGSALRLDAMPSLLAFSAMHHAFALGFVTTMMYGFALRILAVFTSAGCAPPKLLASVFWTQWVGTGLRVAAPFLPAGLILAGAGLNVVAFLTFLVAVVALTAGQRKPVDIQYPVSADMTLGPVLERFPSVLPVLVAEGFTLLENPQVREQMGARVTLLQACRIVNADPDQVLRRVNDSIRPQASPV